MAYTNRWRTTVPSKMVGQHQLDDHIRRLRLEIQERMTVSGIDWTADPVVATATRYIYLHWSTFKILSEIGSLTWTITNGGLSYANALTRTLYGGIILPRNATMVDVHMSCATGANGTIPWAIVYQDATTGTVTETSLASGTIAANTSQGNQALVTSLNHTIDNTPGNYKFYTIRLTFTQSAATGGPIIQGIRVKYTVPNLITNSV